MRMPWLPAILVAVLLSCGGALRARTEYEVHVATAGCGANYCGQSMKLARSFLAQAKLDGGAVQTLHVFTGRPCMGEFEKMRASWPSLFEAGNVTLHDLAQLDIDTPGRDLRSLCNTLRVYLPRLFPHLRKMMYIDADTRVASSLRPLFQLPMSVYMMAEDGGNFYGSNDASHCGSWRNGSQLLVNGTCHPWSRGVNDGVFVADLEQWRSQNIDAEFDFWMRQLVEGNAKMRWNEQDVFNLLSVQHPEYLSRLPCEANSMVYTRWLCFYGNGVDPVLSTRKPGEALVRNHRQPTILHSKFGSGVRYQQWMFLEKELMAAVDRVAQGGGHGARSLCEMSGCGDYVAEATYHDDCWGGWTERREMGFNCTPRPEHYVATDMDAFLGHQLLQLPDEEMGDSGPVRIL
mmetsp:Transcript_37704/g.117528  ORF Transcript_37704/g.117528 Transcript_37704/m.117528 type:complete len:404 (+) Transcript_37704:74-1285(+)